MVNRCVNAHPFWNGSNLEPPWRRCIPIARDAHTQAAVNWSTGSSASTGYCGMMVLLQRWRPGGSLSSPILLNLPRKAGDPCYSPSADASHASVERSQRITP